MTKFLNPGALISAVPIAEGMVVADYGCAGGAFAIELAKIVGEDGKVFAVDVLETALSVVESRVEMEGLTNVQTVRVNLEVDNSDKIPSQSLDIIFLVNVLYQSKLHQDFVKEVHRALKDGGRWIVADWKKFAPGVGPTTEEAMVDPESVQQIAESLGFTFERDVDVGEYHWAKVFIK